MTDLTVSSAGERSLRGLLASKEIVVTCGSGGVGKTTVAAASGAMAAARGGAKVLVLTVDPARRLATALGVTELGNDETRVPDAALTIDGEAPRGELWAAMLDTKSSWDELIRRHAPDDETRDAILGNRLYANVTGTFIQSHDYVAIERLLEIHSSGRYDLIVVDTPPTRHAVDFLRASDRMADFFSSRFLRWLITPARSRLITSATRPLTLIADRILGTQFLADITEFFVLLQTMNDGFAERAEHVGALLRDERTAFVIVTTLEPASVREATFFRKALADERFPLGAIVMNKVLPPYLTNADAGLVATEWHQQSERVAGDALDVSRARSRAGEANRTKLKEGLATVVREVGGGFLNLATIALREREQATALTDTLSGTIGIRVPHLDRDVGDLETLFSIGHSLWGDTAP